MWERTDAMIVISNLCLYICRLTKLGPLFLACFGLSWGIAELRGSGRKKVPVGKDAMDRGRGELPEKTGPPRKR